MDSEQEGEAEIATTGESKEGEESKDEDGELKDAEKPSEGTTPAQEPEGKKVKYDEAVKQDRDKETEEKVEEPTEEMLDETTAEKVTDNEEKHKQDTDEVQSEAKIDESTAQEKIGKAPEKAKTGKAKLVKADKQRKSPAATEVPPKKSGKIVKSLEKGAKIKAKKLAEPSKEKALEVEGQGEQPAEEKKEVEEAAATIQPPEENNEEGGVDKILQEDEEKRTSKSISISVQTSRQSKTRDSEDSPSSRASESTRSTTSISGSGRRLTKKDKRGSKYSRRIHYTAVHKKEPKKRSPFDLEGVVHLIISPEIQAQLGCQIGDQVTTESPWTTVKKHLIEADIEENEKSTFISVQEEIKAYTGDDVLVGYHVASDIPDTFYVCLSERSKTQLEEMLKNMEADREERVDKMMERFTGEWQSLGSEKEIDHWKIILARPLLVVDVQVNTKKEKKPVFEDCDASVKNHSYFKIGPSRVQPTNIQRTRVDEAIQACPEKILAYAQTYLPFPKNIWTQYFYEIRESDTSLTPELTSKLKEFLEHIYDMMEPVISYNSHFDLYRDDYVALVQSERDLAKSKEILYKSYNIFFDVVRCKNKLITACDWHPMWTGIVAVAYAANLRSLCTGKEHEENHVVYTTAGSSHALIWSFVDEISPKLVLECPHQVHALRFCPHDENLLVGGCVNGQVMLWDLTDRLWKVEYKEILTDEQRSYRINLNKHMMWMKRINANNIVRTSVTSCLEFSPQACITDVRWLSPYAELNRLGRYRAITDERKSLQFVTSSEDGLLCIWDLQSEVKGGPVKAHKKKRCCVPEDLTVGMSKYRHLNLIFSPIFNINIKDGIEAGIIRLTFIETYSFPLTYNLQKALAPHKEYTLNDRLFYTVSLQQPEGLPRSELFLGTVEGHALHISWDGYECETGQAVASEICKYASFNDSVHGSPVTSVSRSPFSQDLVLTVSDRIFAIWCEDSKDEPLLWRKTGTRMSCGRWSLYRPSSFIIGNYDGSITTWDLLLRSDNHVAKQTIAGRLITAAYPSRKEPYQHTLAFADFMGSLKVFIVPTAYMECDEEDETAMKNFFSREYNVRNSFREWEKRWWENNSYILEEEQAAKEEEERRLKEEAEIRAKEEAKKALEMEEQKKHKKKEQKASWTERYQKKWEEFQESNMMKVIMNLKRFRKSELLSKLQPLEAIQEEEEKKKLKHKDRVHQAQKLFEDLVYVLFPGTLDAPKSVHRSTHVVFSQFEEIPAKLLDAYQNLEQQSLAYIKRCPFTYDFSWRKVLNESLQRRRALDELVCPRAARYVRYKNRLSNLEELLNQQAAEEELHTDLTVGLPEDVQGAETSDILSELFEMAEEEVAASPLESEAEKEPQETMETESPSEE